MSVGRFGRMDAVRLLGTAAVASLTVSLGVRPLMAAELAFVVVTLQLVAVLLRAGPRRRRSGGPTPPPGALEEAEAAVRSALASQWGAGGRFRRVLRRAVRARLARRGAHDDDDPAGLPPELAALLRGRWEHDRGLTAQELESMLTAVERMTP